MINLSRQNSVFAHKSLSLTQSTGDYIAEDTLFGKDDESYFVVEIN